jgi:hypothetical protein
VHAVASHEGTVFVSQISTVVSIHHFHILPCQLEPPLKQSIFPVHLWYGFTFSAVVSKISPLLHLISFMLLRASTFLCDQTRWSLQLILHVFS